MAKPSKKEKRKRKSKAKAKASRRAVHDRNRERKLAENILRFGKKLNRRQFDAYCYCRMPLVRFTAEEIEWYSLFENKLLGIVIRDVTDNDYGFIVLGRDSRRLFRCIEVSNEFHDAPEKARKALARKISQDYLGKTQDIYPQGDETDAGFDLFTDVIPENEQHHGYRVLKNEPRFEAARNIISEIVNSFVDNDGHFEREFQSVNFQARLWELYLHIYIHNAGLMVENNHPAPDFEVSFFGEKIFIEAVTVNPSENVSRPDLPPPQTHEEIEERLNDFMPIKFGSPLYSKLQKKYWEKEHVSGKPIILAIHDYHNDNAMTWSRTALSEYLYGIRTRIVDGKPFVEDIEKHSWEGKEIPSGFFFQDEAENISAVLFSNQATIPKFNRMGKIAGLGSADVKMIRNGFLYNPDPDAIHPIPFSKDLDDSDYEESWSDGLIMFHNPNAKNPVDPDAFSDISHIFYSKDEGFYGYHQPYDVLGSITVVVTEAKE
ncbi:hypothetical protein [Alloalcanivorax xenomutans]|uniref:hypothetical protein n=1 Tax=Alloalcanivorax xenomutans TaxID=1094342 RepID=UPI002930F40D|nr:hypothetical protein [Alloalcanivorax xenomutans]WOA31780.1 hypothetical protein RVY87_01615 [Alloalcanivorax xenomutans]